MTTPIGVGLIGANPDRGSAASVHLPALLGLPQFRLAAVATTRQESADAAARKWQVPAVCTDPAALAADPGGVLVVVSVRTPAHHELVRTALLAAIQRASDTGQRQRV